MYVCPLCGSGTRVHGTGAFSVYDDGTKWKCHSCGESGDIFDLCGRVENIDGFIGQLKWLADRFGLSENENDSVQQNAPKRQPRKPQPTKQQPKTDDTPTDDTLDDFKKRQRAKFIKRACDNITDPNAVEYLKKRGISDEVAKRFNLGYDKDWSHPRTSIGSPTSPRIIIPTSETSYTARDIRSDLSDGEKQYTKQKVGKTHILNEQALYNAAAPIFVVEGEFDLLSVAEAGGDGISLGSISGIKKLLELVRQKPPIQPLVISLDNDEPGQKASEELCEELKKLNIPHIKYNVAGQYKDANEALTSNREEFIATVQKGNNFKMLSEIKEKADKEKYMSNSALSHLSEFIGGIKASVNTEEIPTGFAKLDNVLDGGLFAGLYVIGGISSVGKTTFTLQMLDTIAESGTDVMLFSLEMARSEIMSKSISRNTALLAIENDNYLGLDKTVRDIMCGKRYAYYTEKEKELIDLAIARYKEYAEHVFIFEGLGDINVDNIKRTVEKHISLTGRKPVVFVDYLQILAATEEYKHSTDKQIIDKSVLELKRLSRDYKIPVVAISSFNRDNYKNEVNTAAFKESDAIEYSSDVLLGLQLKGTGEKGFDEKDAKSRYPREIELVVLKNRNGATSKRVEYK